MFPQGMYLKETSPTCFKWKFIRELMFHQDVLGGYPAFSKGISPLFASKGTFWGFGGNSL
jgi:hypothetical protein